MAYSSEILWVLHFYQVIAPISPTFCVENKMHNNYMQSQYIVCVFLICAANSPASEIQKFQAYIFISYGFHIFYQVNCTNLTYILCRKQIA
jgi:hypothetical protein